MSKRQRSLIIGDVHGCYQELLALLDKAKYDPRNDQLYFVGDVVNKGPLSREVLEFVYNSGAKVVIGNHEMGLIRVYEEKRKDGRSLEALKLSLGKELPFWVEWIKSWPTFIETEDFIVVHAGKIPDQELREEDKSTLCTLRTWDGKGLDFQNPNNPPWHDFYKGQKPIIYGHHALAGLVIKENTIGLDSGCVYGHQLSAISFPDRTVYQVNAKRQYFPIK